MEKQQTKEFYEFGAFQIDVRNRLLFRSGEPIDLNLKEFEVLLFLVLNAGEVVEKDALLTAIWHETFVEEATLARNISRLRKKLEPEGADKIIETLPKRGYRFLPAVTRREQTFAAPVVCVEEETVRRLRVEETVSLTPEEFKAANFNGANIGEILTNGEVLRSGAAKALPPAAENPSSKIKTSPFVWLVSGIALATIFFGGYFIFLRPPAGRASLLASHVTAFSGLSGREEAPAFSPDGKQLVYTWNGGAADAPGDVYVRLVSGGEPVRLTDTPNVQEMYPVFSPDGANIAFVRDYKPDSANIEFAHDYKTYGEVFLIPALGGAERRIARLFSGNFSISFAPDGKSLAVIDTEDSTDGKQAAIYLIDLATGARRRVTAPSEFRYETTPRFAPDGKSLAFVRVFDDQRQDLFTVRLDSDAPQTPRQITFDQTTIHCLTWSADGANIFFVSFRGSNHPALWRVPITGGEPEIITIGSREISNLTAAPDGKTIAFVENVPRNFDIWQTWIDDQQGTKSFLNATYTEDSPAFTPDGENIVFSSWRSEKPELWITDRTSKKLRQLTATASGADNPTVSPDNSRIAYESFDGVSAIVSVVEIETGKISNLTALQNYQNKFQPAWSADGKWIYFPSDRTSAMNIWKVAADGASAETQLTRGGAAKAIPAPDGKTVYYLKEKDSSEVWQISTDGGDERPAPELARVGDFKGVWTNTAGGIYFFNKTAENDWTIKFFDFASRRLKTVGSMRSPVAIYGMPAVAPDGKQILFARYNPNASNIMFAEIEK